MRWTRLTMIVSAWMVIVSCQQETPSTAPSPAIEATVPVATDSALPSATLTPAPDIDEIVAGRVGRDAHTALDVTALLAVAEQVVVAVVVLEALDAFAALLVAQQVLLAGHAA